MAGLLLVFILLVTVSMVNLSAHLRQKEKRIQAQGERLQALDQLKHTLMERLSSDLSGLNVTVDLETAAVRIGDGILFAEDSARLTEQGRTLLVQMFHQYIAVVLSPEFTEIVDRIVIEGHTNSRGSYFYNLRLSQERASAVMALWLEQPNAFQEQLQEKIVASGRSFSDLIHNDQGVEDPVRSRRIEIRLEFRDAAIFQDVFHELFQAK
jgi:chemotaxis protein MotB